jgi:hypothetical protein
MLLRACGGPPALSKDGERGGSFATQFWSVLGTVIPGPGGICSAEFKSPIPIMVWSSRPSPDKTDVLTPSQGLLLIHKSGVEGLVFG